MCVCVGMCVCMCVLGIYSMHLVSGSRPSYKKLFKHKGGGTMEEMIGRRKEQRVEGKERKGQRVEGRKERKRRGAGEQERSCQKKLLLTCTGWR